MQQPLGDGSSLLPSRNHLELELLHRYSNRTYKGLCSQKAEHELMGVICPSLALKYDFLMDGIFALAALDLAISKQCLGEPATYSEAAVEFYSRALGKYRVALGDINVENHLAIYLFSCLAIVLNLALPQCTAESEEGGMIRAVVNLMTLLQGGGNVALMTWDWLEAGPLKVRDAVDYSLQKPESTLDDSTKAAMRRLYSLNDGMYGAGGSAEGEKEHARYKTAIDKLEVHFARDAEGIYKGLWLAWPAMVPKPFGAAIQRSDPMALLIVMHWGVMLDRLKTDEDAWWARTSGQDLLRELWAELQGSEQALLPEWKEAFGWLEETTGFSFE